MKPLPVPRLAMALAALTAFCLSIPLSAWSEGLPPLTLTPEEIKLGIDPSRPGAMGLATLAGDLAKPGPYAVRIRLPSQIKVLPHTHPDDRFVVVMSGTVNFGYGEQFDPAKMRAMPPGSFFIEPARTPHFAWVQGEDAIVQVSGFGPSATAYLSAGSEGH